MPEPIVDSVEVLPSEDNGNIPAESPSVIETPAEPVAPAEVPAEPAKPAESVAELFELPDGRKVDAPTLSKEWKENFYPDYTRKSQALAAKDQSKPEEVIDPLKDPAWVPQSYSELIEIASQKMKNDLAKEQSDRIAHEKAIEDNVVGQLNEIKSTDKSLNENELFLHATKYGFRDLKTAHQNMNDMRALAKNVQQTTAKNIAKRSDPVSVSPGATGARPDPSQFANARDYVRSLNTT